MNPKLLLPILFLASAGRPLDAGAMEKAVQSFAPAEVQLLPSQFTENQERNTAYLLSLEPDRLLHNTRKYCGLEPKAPIYEGWESRGIAGHTLGHYLTAISRQYAISKDKRFRERIDYIVSEMAECQKLYGDGYIGALPPAELKSLRLLKEGDPELNKAWVPWYTQHKIIAGLIDAWTLADNLQAKQVAVKFADWVDSITAGLSPEKQQIMLRKEFGGMSESLVALYKLTGNPRHLEISQRFFQTSLMEPLLQGEDKLAGKHANTQIPKIIGEALRYEVTGEEKYRKIAENFWGFVTGSHLFAIGGNSDGEYFFKPGTAAEHLSARTAETCNTYNMLKLTDHLLQWEPKVAYGDFYEKALYNHILASMEPEHGMYAYFVSLKPGLGRMYSTHESSFWCCLGTGIENPTRYGTGIYYHGADSLWVNLFVPSQVKWKGVTLKQTTKYPMGDTTELTIESAPKTAWSLQVRCPSWAAKPLRFELNGKPLKVESAPGQFARIERVWNKGDVVRVTIPMGLRTEPLLGAPNKVAILYGPLVLAGDFGPVPRTERYPWHLFEAANRRDPVADVPALVMENPKQLLQHLEPAAGEPYAFRTKGIGKPKEAILRPFKDLFFNYYTVYWDILSPTEWAQKEAEMAKLAALQRAEAARVVDEFAPGEQQSEVDHGLVTEKSATGDFMGKKWRDAAGNGFFEFRMKLQPKVNLLRCTYWGGDSGKREFEILVNGKVIATENLNQNKTNEFYDVDYPLPAEVSNAEHIVVRFQPKPGGNTAGGLFGCKILKPLELE